ncbi:hypothetical protein SDC9_176578 [bioreactor metagenome]|uniref:Lipoprotein n=1 Tax=bioreactor metagenome TaxID=1076179 RepID=A0A645GQG3_9ZZZZ
MTRLEPNPKRILLISLMIIICVFVLGCSDSNPKKTPGSQRPLEYKPAQSQSSQSNPFSQPPKKTKGIFSEDQSNPRSVENDRHQRSMENLNRMEEDRARKNAQFYNKMSKDNVSHYKSQAERELIRNEEKNAKESIERAKIWGR